MPAVLRLVPFFLRCNEGRIGDQAALRAAAISIGEVVSHDVAQENVSQPAAAERQDGSHQQPRPIDVAETVMVQVDGIGKEPRKQHDQRRVDQARAAFAGEIADPVAMLAIAQQLETGAELDFVHYAAKQSACVIRLRRLG
ncbi:hypothetical protein [Rhizobium favelukesii]|uniref:hypothetical protein n=1 Tax=Rhizobium favelukesii TaxID=348824 RepID=UPI00215F04D9|nr:hypothetical protein [Rhizobium favelukesii]MCS0461268.1 hypothetical protein [Rhizobium favelukesii]